MFPSHQATMDETIRRFTRYDVTDDEGSLHEDQRRSHIHDPATERSGVSVGVGVGVQYHHSARKRGRPRKPREELPPDQSVLARRSPVRGSDGRSRRGRPRTTSTSLAYRNETPEERSARLTYMRERRRQRVQFETEDQRAARLVESRERTRQKLLSETHEEREKRLKYLRDHQRHRIRTETKEERERRLAYLRDRQKERLRAETPEERERRLSRSRKHRKRDSSTNTGPPEVNAGAEEAMYIRDSQCQVILTEPHPESERDPLDLHDYRTAEQRLEERRADIAAMTIGRVWSLKPNAPIDDKLWYHNQL